MEKELLKFYLFNKPNSSINVSNIKAGIYFIEIKSDNSVVKKKIIIK